MGKEKQKAGMLDEAIKYYKAVLDVNPENLDARSKLGLVFYEKRMYKDAIAYFQAILNVDPEYQDAKMGIAIVKREINRNRAKMVVLITAISMMLCIAMIFIIRYRHRENYQKPTL